MVMDYMWKNVSHNKIILNLKLFYLVFLNVILNLISRLILLSVFLNGISCVQLYLISFCKIIKPQSLIIYFWYLFYF